MQKDCERIFDAFPKVLISWSLIQRGRFSGEPVLAILTWHRPCYIEEQRAGSDSDGVSQGLRRNNRA